MADVSGKFFSAKKVRTGVSPSSPGVEQGETLPPVNPPGSDLNSVGLTMPSAFEVANSPLTSNGTIAVTGAGTVSQYVRGDGSLADFPESIGSGASVSYYLNGSVNQGTIGGVTYYEMNKTPIIGVGTDFTRNSNGYIASFLTDANDPALLVIPAGNWNFETYFEASSGGGSPTFYLELYKYDGTTFSLIASNSGSPKLINDGTEIEAYFSALAVPQTTLTLTDRLAIRIYVTTANRTITLHTENNTLCQVITTFTTGLSALNGLTAQVQFFAVGTSGTNFNIASASDTHTFNLPTASATNRGALASADWSTFNNKQNQLNGTGFVKASGTTITYDNSTYQVTSEKGQPNGYASLDGNGKVPLAQINDALIGNVNYQGLWNASTNNPTLVNPPSSGTKGYYYIVSTAGTFASISFEVGDWIISNGSAWQKVDNTDAVSSVFGRTGNVIAANGDYNTSQVTENTNLYYTEARVSANTDVAANTAARHNAVTLGTANGLSLSTQQLSLGLASAGVTGALSGTDWSTFNSKQNALTNPVTGTGTSGQVAFWNGTTSQTGSNNLFWDITNARLGIGSNIPNQKLDVRGFIVSDSQGNATESAFYLGNSSHGLSRANLQNDIVLYTTSGDVRISSNGAANTSLIIKSNGSVGIGNTTDTTNKLRVNGTGFFDSTLTATQFIRSGGTSSQFLKADGSVDSNTYLTTSAAASTYLPLAGGTLTGALGGTSAVFSSSVTGNDFIFGANLFASRRYATIINGISSAGYTNICNVTGNSLASSVKVSFQGTADSTVVNTLATIIVNHFQDIYIKSESGIYTILTLRVISDNNENYTIQATTDSAFAVNLNVEVFPQNSETVVFSATALSGTTLTHVCSPGMAISSTGGENGNFRAAGNGVFVGNLTAASFIRSGGTSAQFLKADGSVDSNTYYLASNPSAFIALTALSGTAPIQYNNTTGAISITQASGSTNGFLSSTDWNTFNDKTSNVGTVTSVAALTLGTSGTDLSSTVANSTTTPVITLNVPTASAANRGALSAADWTTFNNKQNALTNPVTGTGTTNYLPKFTGASTIGNSVIQEASSNIGIGVSPSYKLDVNGVAQFRDDIRFSATNSSIGYTDAIRFVELGVSTRMTLSSGNLGLGVTPSAWGTFRALQIGTNYGALSFSGIGGTMITNAFFDGSTYRYLNNDFAAAFEYNISSGGGFVWRQAPSGTAGAALTFTQAMTLGSNSGLSIGTPSAAPSQGLLVQGNVGIGVGPVLKLDVQGNAADTTTVGGVTVEQVTLFRPSNGVGGIRSGFNTSTGDAYLWSAQSSGNLYLGTRVAPNNNVNVAILSSGNVGIGTASPSGGLEVSRFGTYSYFSSNANATFPANVQGISLGWNSSGGGGESIIAYNKGGGSTGGLVFANNDGGSYSEKMRITSGGDVIVGYNQTTTTTIGRTFATTHASVNRGATLFYGINDGSNGGMFSYNVASSVAGFNSQYITFETHEGAVSAGERMRITSTGNIGIGTASPAQRLSVNGGVYVASFVGSTTPYITVGTAASGADNRLEIVYNAAGNYGSLGISGYDGIFTVKPNAIGIGTNSPNYLLHIAAGAANPQLQFTSTGTGSTTSDGFHIGVNNSTLNAFLLQKENADLQILTNDSERMRITSGGNVGIGTASPNQRIEVNGRIRVSTNGTNGGDMGVDDGGIAFSTQGATPISFWRNNYANHSMQITSGGNVLIGTATDGGFKLDVNGGLRVQGNNPAIRTDNTSSYTSIVSHLSGTRSWQIDNVGNDFWLYIAASLNTYVLKLASSTGAATFSSSVTATSFFESSDATLKTLVSDNYQAKGIESVIAKLYIKNGKQELGYFAQDLEGVLPSSVSKGSDGLLNLSYREVHTAKIAYLEQKIKQLENELGRFSK